MKQTTHDQVIEFYRSLLASINITEDDNGFLMHSISNLSDPMPIQIKDQRDGETTDKPLVMPTKDNLRRLNDEGLVGFNPLCESTVRGESEVFRRLKRYITYAINQKILVLMRTLATISMSDELIKSLKSNQVEFVANAVGDVQLKDGFVSKLNKSYAAAAGDKSNTLPVSIYIKRDAMQEGSKDPYKRAAIVSFPYAVEASKTPSQLGNVSFAKYEVKSIYCMLDHILPGLTDRDAYSYFGNPSTVPNFTVLIQAWHGIATVLNKSIQLLEGMDPDLVMIDTSWYTKLNKLASWSGVIPSLDSNVGDGEEDVKDRVAAAQVRRPEPAERPRRPSADSDVVESTRRTESSEPVRQKVGSASGERRDSRYDDRRPSRPRRDDDYDDRPSRSRYDERPRREHYADDGASNGNDLLRELRSMSSRETRRRDDRPRYDPYGGRDDRRDSRYDDRRPSRPRQDSRSRSRYDDDYDDYPDNRPRRPNPRHGRGGL